jgi:indole-3-glycerol phosphate synthase
MGLRPGQLLIAEAKTRSPFGFKAEESWEERFELADQYGDWVSVHTDERWGGSFKLLVEARKRTNKTLLAKGLHETDDDVERALAVGADFVLVVSANLPEFVRSLRA